MSEDKVKEYQEHIQTKAKELVESNPGNRCAKYLVHPDVKAEIEKLSFDDFCTFVKCIRTGLENADSGLGCYAMKPSDYTTFKFFFDKVIGDYHKNDPDCTDAHVNDWALPEGSKYDLKELGLENELSMRVRVGRNLASFNLPGNMDKSERIKFERAMLESFEKVKEEFGGNIYSITPDFGEDEAGEKIVNPNLITDEKYQELVDAHVMFKDMDADPYLKVAGISSDWPYGRGCWQSDSKEMIIWFGEEDQLRIMCMKKGFLLTDVFDGLKKLLDCIESVDSIKFATHERFGYVTSCPSNLGTGMRASVHIQLPKLTSDDDGHGKSAATSEIASPLGLSVRGTGGEHTPFKNATVDISPRARLFIKENEIIGALMAGLEKMIAAEKALADGTDAAADTAVAAEAAAEPAAEAAAAEPAAEAAAEPAAEAAASE